MRQKMQDLMQQVWEGKNRWQSACFLVFQGVKDLYTDKIPEISKLHSGIQPDCQYIMPLETEVGGLV